MSILRKTVISLLLVGFILSIGRAVFIHLSYAAEMPRVPDPQTGRVYAITVNHGTVVYVTGEEWHWADFVLNNGLWLAVVCGGALGIVQIYWSRD
jgi:hypothetical protein